MSLPRAEAAPVSGASSPILMGPPWAAAGAGAVPASAVSKVAMRAIERVIMSSLLCSAPPTAERADDAVGSEENDADIHGPQNEKPALGVHAHEVLEEDDEAGADGGADQSARTAQGHHEQGLDGGQELDIGGPDEAVVVSPEDAGHAREGARDDESQVLVEPHVIAQGLHARFAAPYPLETEPEGRDDEEPQQGEGRRRAQQREVEEGQRRGEAQPAELRPGHARNAIVSLRERDPAEG